jgi:hypothetical protein
MNALEHDMFFPQTLEKMVFLCKEFMFFSAGYGYRSHGTIKKKSRLSGTALLKNNLVWNKYYKNLKIEDVSPHLHLDEFKNPQLFYSGLDLRFCGEKVN